MSSPEPSVSVIVPTYNRAGYLREAVESVLAQEPFGGSLEVIVVDDGSTDETPDVLASFGSRILTRRIPHSGVPAVARNAGLELARGRYVAFQDSDDVWRPEKLRRQLRILAGDSDAILVYANCEYIDAEGRPTGRLVWQAEELRAGAVFPDLLRGNFLSTPTVVVPRERIDEVGGFDESPRLVAREDYELWLRLALLGPFTCDDEVLVLVRTHGTNLNRMPDAENVSRTVALYRAVLRAAPPSQRPSVLRRLAEVKLSTWVERGRLNPFGWGALLAGAWYRLKALLADGRKP